MFKKLFFCFIPLFLLSISSFDKKLHTLYNSLNPKSLSQALAFYHLYPDTEYGKKAFARASEMINRHKPFPTAVLDQIKLPQISLDPFIQILTKTTQEELSTLSIGEIETVESLSTHLRNRELKGYHTWDMKEMAELSSKEQDVAKAILIAQFGEDRKKIRSYETCLDFMCLQIMATLEKDPTQREIVDAINNFLFIEQQFKFPPRSYWPKEYDEYTLLPFVIDSRHGVCLGVCTLYLALAQRLGIQLDIYTPPGHIFLSFNDEKESLNIETTARGIHVPSESYLSVNTCSIKKRCISEVIGLNFMNSAANKWQKSDYEGALATYQKAYPFMPEDSLLHTFIGMNYAFLEKHKTAKEHFTKAIAYRGDETIYPDTMVDDYLNNKIDAKGLELIFQDVDQTREAILGKQKEMEKVLEKYPSFRDGIFHLAVTHLQLNRYKEGYEVLKRYHQIDNNNPTVEYYLSQLSMERYNYKAAKTHLKRCEEIICKRKDGHLKPISALKEQLRQTTV